MGDFEGSKKTKVISFGKTKVNISKRMIVIDFLRYFKHSVKFSLTSDELKSFYEGKWVKKFPQFFILATRDHCEETYHL